MIQEELAKKQLASLKNTLSPQLYAALEQPMALTLIAKNKIDLQRIENCYTFSFLLNDHGYACLANQHISFDTFLAVPTHERYTLQYLFQDGLHLLEKGLTTLQKFLAIPEKKRLAYIDNLKKP